MPVGDDFQDLTPPLDPTPKKVYRYPPPNGSGAIPWIAGQTFAQAISAGLPTLVKNKTLSVNATIRVRFEVTQD